MCGITNGRISSGKRTNKQEPFEWLDLPKWTANQDQTGAKQRNGSKKKSNKRKTISTFYYVSIYYVNDWERFV